MDKKVKDTYLGMLTGWFMNTQEVKNIYAYLLDKSWTVSAFITPQDKIELRLKDKRRFGMPEDYVVFLDGKRRGQDTSMILRKWTFNVL